MWQNAVHWKFEEVDEFQGFKAIAAVASAVKTPMNSSYSKVRKACTSLAKNIPDLTGM